MVTVVSVLLSSLANFVGTLNASQILHALSLGNILRCPIAFFDVTPVGRVLNRFSKDVDVMDNVLPMTLRGWASCFFSVCSRAVALDRKLNWLWNSGASWLPVYLQDLCTYWTSKLVLVEASSRIFRYLYLM
jgi:ABC-type multidrug transport system fused ATPase/permease subunit